MVPTQTYHLLQVPVVVEVAMAEPNKPKLPSTSSLSVPLLPGKPTMRRIMKMVALKDILPDDEIGSIALQDMETTAPKRSVDDNFLISKFLSADGRQHVIVLYNLLSGIRLDTVKTEVTHGGMCLTVSHAFCPSFHDIEKLQSTIQDNEILTSDKDDDIRFRSIHEVSRMMKGDNTFVRGDKTISLPIQCQDVPYQKCAIKTSYGEQILFLELRSTERTVKDNNISFVDCVIEAKRYRKRKYCTQP